MPLEFQAEALNGGHKRLAAWRETGSLIGICLAAIIPTIALRLTDSPYTFFSMWFVIISVIGWFLMRGEWIKTTENYKLPIYNVLKDPVLKKLIIFGLCNSAPLAVTSSLFLFYVDSVLVLPQYSGLLLLTFFYFRRHCCPNLGKVSRPLWR
jgi:GPH family glycoside/pentoside/hexuronide:cation symporter